MNNTAKIRIKVGLMEIEYEGGPAFLDSGIEKLFATMGELAARVSQKSEIITKTEAISKNESKPPSKIDLSVNAIAGCIGANKGPELAICAMAYLQIVQNKETCTKDEILAEMIGSIKYYRKSMGGNLKRALDGLVKNKTIKENSNGVYALEAKKREQIERKLDEIK